MYLAESDLAEIRKHESKFVSFKFLDINGNLQQLDTLLQNFTELQFFIEGTQHSLQPFYAIRDPFRSNSTTSLFCENSATSPNFRKKLADEWEKFAADESIIINLWQSFFVLPLENQDNNSHMQATEPIDKFADMRSDIVNLLNEMNINTTFHFHGYAGNESIIGIKEENLSTLIDKLVILRYVIKNVALSYGYNIEFSQNATPNLKLDIFAKDEAAENILKKLLENKKSIHDHCKEIVAIEMNTRNEKFQKDQGKGALSVKFSTENNYNPYFLILNLLIYSL